MTSSNHEKQRLWCRLFSPMINSFCDSFLRDVLTVCSEIGDVKKWSVSQYSSFSVLVFLWTSEMCFLWPKSDSVSKHAASKVQSKSPNVFLPGQFNQDPTDSQKSIPECILHRWSARMVTERIHNCKFESFEILVLVSNVWLICESSCDVSVEVSLRGGFYSYDTSLIVCV